MMRSPFVKIIGIIFAVAGLYFIYQNINGFVETCNQKVWETATATVVNIRQRYESHGIHSRGSKLVYDVFYEYTADGKIYSGTIYGTADYSKKPAHRLKSNTIRSRPVRALKFYPRASQILYSALPFRLCIYSYRSL